MKILHLILRRYWWDMIDSGKKPEEYREITNHWMARILTPRKGIDAKSFPWAIGYYAGKCDVVEFQLGYAKDAPRMRFKIQYVRVDVGEEAWGAPPRKVFIIRLGDRIEVVSKTGKV